MYTMVLMMAVSGSGDQASWGHRGGCHGSGSGMASYGSCYGSGYGYGGSCYGGGISFQSNLWWHESTANPNNTEAVLSVWQADAGFDVNGNIYTPRVSPLAGGGSFELSATSLGIDKGSNLRSDGGLVSFDYLKRPRVVGSQADIGAAEKP